MIPQLSRVSNSKTSIAIRLTSSPTREASELRPQEQLRNISGGVVESGVWEPPPRSEGHRQRTRTPSVRSRIRCACACMSCWWLVGLLRPPSSPATSLGRQAVSATTCTSWRLMASSKKSPSSPLMGARGGGGRSRVGSIGQTRISTTIREHRRQPPRPRLFSSVASSTGSVTGCVRDTSDGMRVGARRPSTPTRCCTSHLLSYARSGRNLMTYSSLGANDHDSPETADVFP